MNTLETTVAIIGGGPAGCATALQLKRMDIPSILFEEKTIGGLAINANLIENFLGFPQGISGEEFVKLLDQQLEANVVEVVFDKIENVSYDNTKFHLSGIKKNCICDYLVIATGTKPKKIDYPNSDLLESKGKLFYEPKDVPKRLRKNHKIAIIGGGDAAFDYAINFSQFENEVMIIHRSEDFKCLPLLYNRATNIEEIELLPSTIIHDFQLFDDKVQINYENHEKIIVDFVLVAIGRFPNDDLLTKLPVNELTDRLFVIGDIKNDKYRQISITAGEGIKCAMELASKIKSKI
ncbi:MAG: NAD(P)/FAD-dependent oxidoreductase [Asgard group archaeon]|nr:NAD(P)/FAD-dependent oxidoreductase [Asgard group archaeon]